MKLSKINSYLGKALFWGIVITQPLFTIAMFKQGGMAEFLALFSALLFLPFFISSLPFSFWKQNDSLTLGSIVLSAALLVLLPIIMLAWFDTFYILLICYEVIMAVAFWKLYGKRAWQLFFLNSFGMLVLLWFVVMVLFRVI
ncbi:hypothetical protein SAMN05216480_110113 [Pustulibacterium marinum]|uniref:Uncharacterized protein n=1 Tax=Pustulibacterium marinum TaxID=1224947 RepID=A0A1I7HPS3_9FLAO|nr:hypothetical protein [Pustulibacterium marinum]SFU62722.1 hypothetical protein SAMN05216480_110113 [Pustulibacterium marinum]